MVAMSKVVASAYSGPPHGGERKTTSALVRVRVRLRLRLRLRLGLGGLGLGLGLG